MKNIYGIVAVDSSWGMAKNFKIPWHYPVDFKHFKKTTNNSTCIMGYNTYKELASLSKYPDRHADLLPNRSCVVMTNFHKENVVESENCYLGRGTLLETLNCVYKNLPTFIIGGANLYLQSIEYCEGFYVTELKKFFDCDTFFPKKVFDENFTTERNLYSDNDMSINYWKRRENPQMSINS